MKVMELMYNENEILKDGTIYLPTCRANLYVSSNRVLVTTITLDFNILATVQRQVFVRQATLLSSPVS